MKEKPYLDLVGSNENHNIMVITREGEERRRTLLTYSLIYEWIDDVIGYRKFTS